MNPSHADLINSLRKTERLTDKTAQAMMQVDRKFFLDPDNQSMLHLAYEVSECWYLERGNMVPGRVLIVTCTTNRITLYQ